MLQIHQFPCLEDNYGILVHDPESGETTTIDTPDAGAILRECAAKGWRLTQIWNTHWHPDHAGGNAELKQKTGCLITGPAEVARIGLAPDRIVVEGDGVHLGEVQAAVIDVGGHTLGHIAYYIARENVAFVGDSLFALGCGRMFEGEPEQFWTSLSKLAALPDDTTLYCAHEYTASNARFALSVDPDNEALKARAEEIKRLRAADKPTVPMTLAEEKRTNPFLRAPVLKARLGMAGAPDHEAFARIRQMKDSFR
ncbi:MAG: hydroxyacylglutathione hydrolase [Hydrogenophilaceae bacterium]|jgi:hydroxyacylglutathione hydrolase|nr:hydroxyacylglutathione hydrolase [Hydrogenophilaceae bacterium]